MTCLNCEFCIPEDVDPETLDTIFCCDVYNTEIKTFCTCDDFVRLR